MQPVPMTLTRPLSRHVRTSSFLNFLVNLPTNFRILDKTRTMLLAQLTFFPLILYDETIIRQLYFFFPPRSNKNHRRFNPIPFVDYRPFPEILI